VPGVRRSVALLSIAVVLAGCSHTSDPLAVKEVSIPLPAVSGPTLDGATYSPSEHAGNILVVNFWASWCGPCKQELPALRQVYDGYRARGVDFVGVDERDNAPAATAMATSFKVPYPIVEDPSGSYSDDFAFFGLPATYVADAAGTIRFVIPRRTTVDELSGLLDRVLAEAGSGNETSS
jgi:thiol-disulfide isomerase/thioredoxin